MSVNTQHPDLGDDLSKEKTSSDTPSRSDAERQAGPEGVPEDEAPVIPLSPLHEAALIFLVCIAQFLALAGLAQSVAPLSIIGRGFDVTNEGELSWYPAAFSLTVGTFILPAGRLVSNAGTRCSRFSWLIKDFRATCTATVTCT